MVTGYAVPATLDIMEQAVPYIVKKIPPVPRTVIVIALQGFVYAQEIFLETIAQIVLQITTARIVTHTAMQL